MKLSFSTLACPDWTLEQVVDLAVEESYNGIELRFLENEDSLWKLPCFQGDRLRQSRNRIADAGLSVGCVDTSCRFDSPDSGERERWIEEGRRMSSLAAELRAPGIRVFADRIHPGTDRETTRAWVIDGLRRLTEENAGSGVQVWLETHGDFCTGFEVQQILAECPGIALVWDPAPAFIENGERPSANGAAFHGSIRHIHIKDLNRQDGDWTPVLTEKANSL
jgi:sugar phosphate isomerase/epimerase